MPIKKVTRKKTLRRRSIYYDVSDRPNNISFDRDTYTVDNVATWNPPPRPLTITRPSLTDIDVHNNTIKRLIYILLIRKLQQLIVKKFLIFGYRVIEKKLITRSPYYRNKILAPYLKSILKNSFARRSHGRARTLIKLINKLNKLKNLEDINKLNRQQISEGRKLLQSNNVLMIENNKFGNSQGFGRVKGCKSQPVNLRLYNRIKNDVKRKVKRLPSAYASGQLVRRYKSSGGKYKSSCSRFGNLKEWYAQKWVDVCTGRPCGRKAGEKRKYPYCRPTRTVGKTPRKMSQLTPAQIKQRCKRKRLIKGKRLNNFGKEFFF